MSKSGVQIGLYVVAVSDSISKLSANKKEKDIA